MSARAGRPEPGCRLRAMARPWRRPAVRPDRKMGSVPRHIPIASLYNFRDVGGYRTGDGHTVRWGRLYRSDSLAKLHGEDWERFLALGIRTVIDLRHPHEADARGRVPRHDGLDYRNISVEHRPYDQAGLSPAVEPARFLADRYAELAMDGVAEFRQVLAVIAAEGSAPVVIHCAAGKDRTGVLTALILSLLGVARADIIADYALTGLVTDRLISEWRAGHSGLAPRWPAFGQAPPGAMQLFLAGLDDAHGSVRGYAASQLGVGDELVTALRMQLLGDGKRAGLRAAGTPG
jgi:protein-tyrosine phosphatase